MDTDKEDECPFYKSKRWRVCVLLFLAYTIMYLHRVNLNMAVVCMLPPTDVIGVHNDYGNSTEDTNRTEASTSTNWTNTDLPTHLTETVSSSNRIETAPSTIWAETVSPTNWKNKSSSEENSNVTFDTMEAPYTVDWDRPLISGLLSSYFYGSCITQIPGGKMADKFGGKNLMLVVYIVTAIGSLLTPICVKIHVTLVFVIRILIGLAAGVVLPVGVAMIGVWAPPKERAAMLSLSACGVSIGPAISYLTSGYMCAYGFDGGWPSIFYIHGIAAALFVVLWWFQAYSSPSEHPSISNQELVYIQSSRKHISKLSKIDKTPWRSIWLSRPVWASILGHCGLNWGFFTILINIPIFMKELLQFDITQNAFYSALPYLCFCGANIFWAKIAFTLLERNVFTVLTLRKLFTFIGLVGPSVFLIAVGHLTIQHRYFSVVFLCMTCVLASMCFSGVLANHAEYSGLHSGTVYGITNAFANATPIFAALVAGLMTPNGSRSEWHSVFYLSAGMSTTGAVVFCVFASATLQEWTKPTENH